MVAAAETERSLSVRSPAPREPWGPCPRVCPSAWRRPIRVAPSADGPRGQEAGGGQPDPSGNAAAEAPTVSPVSQASRRGGVYIVRNSTSEPSDPDFFSTRGFRRLWGDMSEGKSGGASKDDGKKVTFTIKKWNAVAFWSWDIYTDTCAICRNPLHGPSIEYQVRCHGRTFLFLNCNAKRGGRHIPPHRKNNEDAMRNGSVRSQPAAAGPRPRTAKSVEMGAAVVPLGQCTMDLEHLLSTVQRFEKARPPPPPWPSLTVLCLHACHSHDASNP